jgi:hypothetical protein
MEVGGRAKHPKAIDAFLNKFDSLILLFDTTNIKTFKDLESILTKANPDQFTPVIIIGTKADLKRQDYFASSYTDDPLYLTLEQKGYTIVEMALYEFDYSVLEKCFNSLCSIQPRSAHDIVDFN